MSKREYAMQDLLDLVNEVYHMARRCPRRSTERSVLLTISRDMDEIRTQLQSIDKGTTGEDDK